MLKRNYGLFYKNGRWYVRNYGRVIKTGKHGDGMSKWMAGFKACGRNFMGETPIIDLKRIVPRPGPKEEYGRQDGDLITFSGSAQEMIKKFRG